MATWTASSCCATTRRWPATGNWRATTTWSSGRTPTAFSWPTARRLRRAVCGHVRLRRPDQGRTPMQRRHDHEHDAAAGRGPGLALGAPESGQVHVDQLQPDYPDTVCNGLWEYRPGLQQGPLEERRSQDREHRHRPGGPGAEEGKTGTIIWTMRSPYVFVGGRLEVEGSGARFAVSLDGKNWTDARNEPGQVLPDGGPAALSVSTPLPALRRGQAQATWR